jgi:alkylhydroperoxidase family enzyme
MINKLVKHESITDILFEAISSQYTETELIDIIHIVGLYTGVAMLVAFATPSLDNYKKYMQ